MAILFVAAEAMELKPFANALTGLRKLSWPLDYAYEGILDGKRMMLAANGAGSTLASQAVEVALRAVIAAELSSSKLEAVVSTGFCGALDSSLHESQIVLASSVVDEQTMDATDCAMVYASPDGFVTGTVASANRVVQSSAEKAELGKRCGAIAVDMESSGAMQRTLRAGLPFYCIKSVTDRADESFALDLNRMRTSEGRVSRGKIMSYALSHPNVIPHVLRLKRRAEGAAEALGEFLVSCRILPESGSNLPGE